MCLPGTTVNLPTICEYDENDIFGFGLKHKVDYIAVSFARYLKDLKNLRKHLIERDPIHGPNIHIISKI
jgi:pyruvate kinase